VARLLDRAAQAGENEQRLQRGRRHPQRSLRPRRHVRGRGRRLDQRRPTPEGQRQRHHGRDAEHGDASIGPAPAGGSDEVLHDRRPDRSRSRPGSPGRSLVLHTAQRPFLGTELANKYPLIKSWAVGPPSKIELDSMITGRGEYIPRDELRLQGFYPTVMGYKGHVAAGLYAELSDPLGYNELRANASYSPARDITGGEQLHADISYRTLYWHVRYWHNSANFYDLFGPELAELPSYGLMEGTVAGHPVVISQTGFTGEKGYELLVPWDRAVEAWNMVLEAGAQSIIAMNRIISASPLYHRPVHFKSERNARRRGMAELQAVPARVAAPRAGRTPAIAPAPPDSVAASRETVLQAGRPNRPKLIASARARWRGSTTTSKRLRDGQR